MFARWKLGTCVPVNILGRNGYLGNHQAQIETLALLTDSDCKHILHGANLYDLTRFSKIKAFSWVGCQFRDDFEALRDFFGMNAKNLEILDLNIVDWSRAGYFWDSDNAAKEVIESRHRVNFFAEEILNISLHSRQRDDRRISFPKLRSLSLGHISFISAVGDLADAFSIFQLRHLKLWKCPGTSELLRHLTKSGQMLQLKSLELTYIETRHDLTPDSEVAPLLLKLSDLHELYISLPAMYWVDIMGAIGTHVKSLKRVALGGRHVQGWNMDDDMERGECLPFHPELKNLLTSGECEFFGAKFRPSFLVSDLPLW